MILNLTREEAVVLKEFAIQQRGRFIYLGKHTVISKLLAKLRRLKT
jgi:hypothetical protein